MAVYIVPPFSIRETRRGKSRIKMAAHKTAGRMVPPRGTLVYYLQTTSWLAYELLNKRHVDHNLGGCLEFAPKDKWAFQKKNPATIWPIERKGEVVSICIQDTAAQILQKLQY